jgi:predicted component of type VI protein secretion system
MPSATTSARPAAAAFTALPAAIAKPIEHPSRRWAAAIARRIRGILATRRFTEQLGAAARIAASAVISAARCR